MATFKHKQVSRFRIGAFEFKNHILAISPSATGDKSIAEFRRLVENMKSRDRLQIVEINEQALASLERPMSRGIRGVTSTGNIESPTTEGSLAKLEDERAREAAATEELIRLQEERARNEAAQDNGSESSEQQGSGGPDNTGEEPVNPAAPKVNPNMPASFSLKKPVTQPAQ